MLGYRLGFAVAALLAAMFALLTWQLVGMNRLTPPTSLLDDTAARRPLSTEVPPSAVYRSETPGDAGAIYRQVIADVQSGQIDYAALLNAADPQTIEAAPAVAMLMTAAPLAGQAVLAADTAKLVSYDATFENLDALVTVGRCAGRAALLRLSREPERAKPLFEAQFALGVKLFDERIRYAEAAAGLDLARDAAAGLRDIAARAGDDRRAALLATFDRSAAGLAATRMSPVWNAVGALDGTLIARHTGDVHALVGRDVAERMWRIEAVLALGRHRFNAQRPADQLIVTRRLSEIEQGETDPAVLAAIHAAKSLTIEQYRTIR